MTYTRTNDLDFESKVNNTDTQTHIHKILYMRMSSFLLALNKFDVSHPIDYFKVEI